MTRLEEAHIDEVGDITPTKGQNHKLGLKVAGMWMSIFASQGSLEKLQDLVMEHSDVDWVCFEKGEKYTNISEIQVGGQRFGKPDKKKAGGGGGSSAARPEAPVAPSSEQMYADVTVIVGRTISVVDYENYKRSYAVTRHGVAIKDIDKVQVEEEKRLDLWLEAWEASHK